MELLFDSILLNSLQMESQSGETLLDCTVYERGHSYDTQIVLSDTAMNLLMNELACRDIELDFEKGDRIPMPDGTEIYHLNLDSADRNPLFLPLYILPESMRLLRA